MGVTNWAVNSILGTTFPTGPNTWYIGLINNSPSPVLSPTDILSNHSGWSEANGGGTIYTGNRPLWTNGSASNQSITNASPVTFAIVGSVTIYGVFLCSVATGSSGNLFGTGQLIGGPQSAVSGDTLSVTITVNGASS